MNNQADSPNKVISPLLVIMVIFNLALLAWVGWPYLDRNGRLSGLRDTATPAVTQTPVHTPTPDIPTTTPSLVPTLFSGISPQEGLRQQGVIILSMTDGNYAHLFAYHPQFMPLTRLTNSDWDDINPAISPNGSRLLYASRQNGYFDLYDLDFASGITTPVTDTPEYDGAPTWAPDNQWIAYETYMDGNLEVVVRSMTDLSQPVIRLTENTEPDFSPTWSPGGREIAFVSTRSGDEEIWLARLDQINNRFTNISHAPGSMDEHPAWSPDGRYLSWTSDTGGFRIIKVWDSQHPDQPAQEVGSGSWPVWNPGSDAILTEILGPSETALNAFRMDGNMIFPTIQLPGALHGMDWKAGSIPDFIANFKYPENAAGAANVLWNPALTVNPMPPDGRFGLVPLSDVSAPYAYLHDAVDESFQAMRQQVAREVGWDAFSSLENAYVALTEPPTPSMEENWLLTGRGIALNPLPSYAGWMVIVKEDFDGQTYWRLFLKTRYQDGSQGLPLSKNPWDLTGRYSGSPVTYENGGSLALIPSGYWVDFSELALRYKWERLPAQVSWRTFYPATRFNQYVLRDGLSWYSAMGELYPQEILATGTRTPTATPTVTETPEDYHPVTLTPFPTSTMTPTPTIHATWTSQPGDTSP
jgi:TolB protein